MSFEGRETDRKKEQSPQCLFCDIPTRSIIVIHAEDVMVRGWKCQRCEFTLIHPHDVSKALALMKEILKMTQSS